MKENNNDNNGGDYEQESFPSDEYTQKKPPETTTFMKKGCQLFCVMQYTQTILYFLTNFLFEEKHRVPPSWQHQSLKKREVSRH